MKVVIAGSLGNIGKPLAQQLVQKGHSVVVISRKTERQKDIEAIGAQAAIGTMEDVDFLAETFQGTDILYSMVANDSAHFFDPNADIIAFYRHVANNYKQAIERSGIQRVIHLSSVGAHTDRGNGILRFHYDAENILRQLPDEVSIKFMRPAGFFTNIFRSLHTIKTHNAIVSNYGGDTKEPWVSPLDIASVIAEEIELPFDGRSVRYIASEEVSPNEIAKVLGEAIGNPELQWLVISDEQLLNSMVSLGMNAEAAKGFVDMQASQGSGLLYEDYYRHRPTLGTVKLADFARDFAQVFHQQ